MYYTTNHLQEKNQITGSLVFMKTVLKFPGRPSYFLHRLPLSCEAWDTDLYLKDYHFLIGQARGTVRPI